MTGRDRSTRPGLIEPLVAWTFLGLLALAVLVTYSRLPPEELWNVSESGIRGGLGRALVLLNFPVALVAIALAGFAAARVETRLGDRLAVASVPLCLVVAVPGTMDGADADAKLVNAVPAVGVALALAVTVLALRARGVGTSPRAVPFDRVRIGLAALLLFLAIPWIGAESGFHVSLGGTFESDRVVPEPGHPNLAAVHLGHHHGTDGVVFSLAALLLTRGLGRVGRPRLRVALTAYLALMLAYGIANTIDDLWLEQVVKRGWSDFVFPGMLQPQLSLAWLAIIAGAAAVYALLRRTTADPRP